MYIYTLSLDIKYSFAIVKTNTKYMNIMVVSKLKNITLYLDASTGTVTSKLKVFCQSAAVYLHLPILELDCLELAGLGRLTPIHLPINVFPFSWPSS